jgi:organic radical activating enzyme
LQLGKQGEFMADLTPAPTQNIIADFDISTVVEKISQHGVIIFGAGLIGQATLNALLQLNISKIHLFDNDKQKHMTELEGVPILPPEQLPLLSSQTPILVATVYITPVMKQLQTMGFSHFYACTPFLNLAKTFPTWPASVSHVEQRSLDLYSFTIKTLTDSAGLYIKSVDVVLTEKCTLKCHDCANLMQYYEKPKHCLHTTILKATERFISAVDHLFEFRLLGGEPFVDKKMHDILNRLCQYEKVSCIIVYTNGTILPSNDVMESLKNKKVQVQVTDYGPLSRQLHSLLAAFDQQKINYTVVKFDKWQDCGGIEYRTRTKEELKRLYANCCAADTYTLLHGTLFPCPFSSHAINLGAIPSKRDELVILDDETTPVQVLRENLRLFTQPRLHLQACEYCGGRDFGQATIPAAIQAPHPRPYKKQGVEHAQ